MAGPASDNNNRGDPLWEVARSRMRAWELLDPIALARTDMALVFRVQRRDGRPAVLKCLTEIGRREEGTAPAVLAAFGGSGAVQLLKADLTAHLIEHCAGSSLGQMPEGHTDAVALPVLTGVLARLRAANAGRPDGVLSLADRCKALDKALSVAQGPARDLLIRARQIADALLTDGAKPALLHGDLHHENILGTSRADGPCWLAIDPQAVWGDPAYDVANLFGNPVDHPDISLAWDRPLHIAAAFEHALGLGSERMLKWAYVHCGISAAWALEDGVNARHRTEVAKRIRAVL